MTLKHLMFNLYIVCLSYKIIMEKKSRLFEQVSDHIRKDIKNGKFAVGQKIPSEPALMELYQVGRSTIREAIKSLALSGILTVQQGFGTIVNQVREEAIEQRLKSADFTEINEVRAILEREIVGRAATSRSDGDLEMISAALQHRENMIKQENRQECITADIEFHLSIARSCSNQVLTDLYTSFTQIIRDFFSRREPSGVTHFAMSHHLHIALFQAIAAADRDRALQIIDTILNNNH